MNSVSKIGYPAGWIWTAAALLTVLAVAGTAEAATTYYVAPAPTGSDSNAGTMEAPFASFAKAQTAAAAGDTVYFRGGTYAYTAGTTTCSSGTATISGVVLNKNGASGNLIHYLAYPGEIPVFDFAGIKDSCRVKGIYVQGNFIHLKGFELKGVPQNNMLNHESWGIWVSGSSNLFEQLNLHHNMGPGLFIQNGSNNLVLNCDSHHNYDTMTSNGAGESADGFGAHVSANNPGNVFRGCRAWWNSDDGFDLINAFDVVTIENSWSWYNGYVPDTMTAASNGNGFKAGGYGTDTSTFPANPPKHVVRGCLSFLNRTAGFYANHHPGPVIFNNNTGYNNHPDFNLLGMDGSGADIHVGILRNNLAFAGTLLSNDSGTDNAFNSWTVSGVTVAAADFQSTTMTGVDGPRAADGSLPNLSFMRLAAGSDLIDKGTDVGLPFAGAAPDLGAFEVGLSAAGGGASASGGAPGTGGAGGRVGSGGATGAGGGGRAGTTGTGGSAGAGGRPNAGSGGAVASGGSGGAMTSGSGGAASGGNVGTGGLSATGGTSGSGSGGATSSGSGGATSSGSGGAPTTGSGGATPPGDNGASGGCACAVNRAEGDAVGLVALALASGLVAGRRRRRSR